MDALLVLDFQAAVFLDQPVAHRAGDVEGILSRTAAHARSAEAPVIFIRHSANGLWDPASPGWAFPADLTPTATDIVIDKTSCDAFRATSLEEVLKCRGVTRIWIGGYATEFCVDTTVRSAAARGICTAVIADAHTTRDRPHLPAVSIIEHHNWIWSRLTNPGNPIQVLPSGDVPWSR